MTGGRITRRRLAGIPIVALPTGERLFFILVFRGHSECTSALQNLVKIQRTHYDVNGYQL